MSEGVGGNAPFRLQAIDMNIGQVIRNYSKMKVNPRSIALFPTGDVFAISSSDSYIVQFYSLNGEKPIHLVNVGNNGRVYFGGTWRVDGTHGTVGRIMNIIGYLAPGESRNVSSQLVRNLQCKMDNMQVFVRGTRVQYEADAGKFIGPT